jgi:hypothetical protein
MTTDKLVQDIAKADDLIDLMDHIAWEKTIAPALAQYKDNYQTLLVQAVLGQSVVDTQTGQVISKEMLAGRIEGINWINKFLLSVIKRGQLSHSELNRYSVS